MISSITQLMKLAVAVESRGLHDIVSKIPRIIREIHAAAADAGVQVESWVDFLGWWNNNRGQSLMYLFIDTYGDTSEQVTKLKSLLEAADEHEKNLHEFYMYLRAGAAKAQQQAPENPTPAAPPEAPAPVAEEPKEDESKDEESEEDEDDEEADDEADEDSDSEEDEDDEEGDEEDLDAALKELEELSK